ncbi:hypothetical protein PFISCL1PPCAC_26825, partial [Pristionchus fissidentatus]
RMKLVVFLALSAIFLASIDCKKVKKAKVTKEEQHSHPGEVVDSPFLASHFVRPKQLQQHSKYDKCKQECARIKEQEDMQLYLVQLREELAAAEAMIAEEEALTQ